MNFQMFKLDLDKAEEPEIKLPTSPGSLKKQESSRKNIFCFIDYAKAFDCVDHNRPWKFLFSFSFFFKYKFIYFNWKLITLQYCIGFAIHKEIGTQDHLTCLMRNLYVAQEATIRTGHGTTD